MHFAQASDVQGLGEPNDLFTLENIVVLSYADCNLTQTPTEHKHAPTCHLGLVFL